MTALTAWVRDGREPPASAVPRIADGTLVAPDTVRFPAIPANAYGGVERPALRYIGAHNPLHVLDYGPAYRAGDIERRHHGRAAAASAPPATACWSRRWMPTATTSAGCGR